MVHPGLWRFGFGHSPLVPPAGEREVNAQRARVADEPGHTLHHSEGARLVLCAHAVAAGSTSEFAGSVDPSALATVIIGVLRGVALQSMLDDGADLDACRVEVEAVLTGRLVR
jgi:hypothetical protein